MTTLAPSRADHASEFKARTPGEISARSAGGTASLARTLQEKYLQKCLSWDATVDRSSEPDFFIDSALLHDRALPGFFLEDCTAMKTDNIFGSRLLAPGLVLFSTVLLASSDVMAQAPNADPLVEALEEAEARRDAAYRELELRRAEYLDALQRAEQRDRREVARPSFVDPRSFVDPLPPYGSGGIRGTTAYGGALNPTLNPRPYVLRPNSPTPFAGPIGRPGIGYGPGAYSAMPPVGPGFGYGPGYGYGYGAPGGIDIPFGFGLGGLSIRW